MLVAPFVVVACAAPPTEKETASESSSRETSDAPGAATPEITQMLDQLQTKVNNCELLSTDEVKQLNALQGKIDFTFEAYVSLTCTVEAGKIVVGAASMETRAGWSSSDGAFVEQAFTTTASVDVELELATVDASVSKEVTIRQAGVTTTEESTTEVAVGVEKDLGIVTGAAEVAMDGSSITVSGSLTTPLVIKTSDCGNGGEATVGATVALTAEHVDTADKATAARAGAILVQHVANVDFFDPSSGEDAATSQQQCCIHFEKCSLTPTSPRVSE